MIKILLPIATLALIMAPAAANAAQCRDSASGKFAKCGSPGAVPAGQYVAKTKSAKAAPAAKPGMMSMMKPKAKSAAAVAPAPAPATAKVAPAAAKVARCKTATGKFAKCGTPGAMPA